MVGVNEILEAALDYARRGRPVFPCNPRTKNPVTEHGFYDASTDPKVIEGWFGSNPRLMIGMPTGAAGGLVVIDLDGELEHVGDIGLETMQTLEREHGRLPKTESTVTPSGGQHLYFKNPEAELRNSAGRIGRRSSEAASGIDVRADGGYAILPPSARTDGRRYEVDDELPPAELPTWLLKLALEAAGASAKPPGDHEAITSGRHEALLAWATSRLYARGILGELALDAMYGHNLRCVEPPIDDVERLWKHLERTRIAQSERAKQSAPRVLDLGNDWREV